MALLRLGTTEFWAGRFDEAERHLEQARALARQIGRPYLEFASLVYRARVETVRSLALVFEPAAQAIELARRHGWTDDPLAGDAYLSMGAALLWRGRLDEAEPWIQRAERTVREESEPAGAVRLHWVRAQFELAGGREKNALAAFRVAERQAQRLVAPHPLAGQLRGSLLRTLVRTGAAGQAEQALTELGEKERETAEARITMAALRLARGDPRAATLALAPVIDGSAPVLHRVSVSEAREIADELTLSWYTVKTHMRHLYAKLGTHTRHETVDRARALGLLAPSPRRLAS